MTKAGAQVSSLVARKSRELAARGYAALAFDFKGWGESEGAPRYVEDSAVKTADIRAATDYLAGRDDIAAISGLGVCASSGYMAAAVADDARLRLHVYSINMLKSSSVFGHRCPNPLGAF